MAIDTYGHRYDEDQAVLTCARCGVAQAAASEYGILCSGDQGEQRANAIGGMLAAIEYARTMYGGMAGGVDRGDVQEGLDFIAADCIRGKLDILGSMASITLRAAQKAADATGGTVAQFLDELQTELNFFGESPA